MAQARRSFNERFWFEDGQYLYDVIDAESIANSESGKDDSLRPNQLFAISLTHPVLRRDRWAAVLESCLEHLLTPVGLRSLARTSDEYIGVYHGDVYQRDAAYHQGTVWSWLIGPLVKAWCRTHPHQKEQAAAWLNGLESHLGEGCIGQIGEIFSGDPPHEPEGCFAQAWGIAELLEAHRVINENDFASASQSRTNRPLSDSRSQA